jgi:hypothetical protein
MLPRLQLSIKADQLSPANPANIDTLFTAVAVLITLNIHPLAELAAGTHTLTANVAGSDNYNAASATVEITVDKADQVITWANPANIVYGTLLSATQLNAAVAVPGSEAHGALTYSPAADAELAAGTHTLTANVAGSDNYNAASATVEITVDKADQVITWANPANIVYGTLLSATQLNAAVAVPGSEAHGALTYSPAADAELAAGTHTLTANVAGSDNYNAASATVEITVDKADQVITWANPANIVYGTLLSATQLNAAVAVPGSEAHGALTYSPAADAELAAGTHTLTANVAGSDNYNAASATVEITVDKADQVITWANPANIVYGTLLSATQLNAAVAVPGSEAHGALTYSPAADAELAAGTHTLTANVAGSDNYNAASATVEITVDKADQVITWANPANIVYGTLLSATQLNAAVAVPGSEAHGALTYSPAADAELAAGTHTLTANVAGSDNYNAASATVEITVDKADQVITWANPANIVYGTLLSATQLNAAVAVPGSEAHGALTYSPAADAELAAGTHTLTANVAGSDNYNAASATVEITVDKADQVITWANPANIVYGTLLSATQLNAAVAVPGSEVHGALTYSPAADAELAAGTHTLTANVAGSDNYNAASATVEITVDKADQVITWANPANIVYGTLLSATQLNAAVAVPGSEAHGALTYSPAADAELAAGTHTLTANVAGSDNYNAASATVEITVDKADQVITWANPANIVYGTLLSATQLNAAVAVPGSEAHGALTYSPAADAELAAGTHTLTANVAGSDNYNAASATVEITVDKADQVITWANPANIVYGTLLSATQLNAAVAVPGSEAHGALTYSPAADAELAAGTHTLTANVAGSDNYNAASATVEITVDKADQVITWANPANIVYGTLLSATQLNAAVAVPGSEAHGALTYSPAADAELAAGTHTLTANVAGSDNYNAASATVEITVDKADQVITWANPANIVYGTLLSATQLNAAVAVPGSEAHGALTYSPAAGTILNAGADQELKVYVAGSDNYNPARMTVLIKVLKADLSVVADNIDKYCGQTLTFEGTEFTTEGLVNGDAVNSVTLTSAGLASTASLSVSPYVIEPSEAKGAGLSNYDIRYVKGKLTILAVFIDVSESSTPIPIGSSATLKAKVTDGSGNPVSGVSVRFLLNDNLLTSIITGSNGYAEHIEAGLQVGVYKVTAIAGSGCAQDVAYLPVYDPNGGFVTGGGWILSPVGAYTPDETLTGKATFGFVSKYKKGSNVPEGNTEFQFHAGNLNFKSSEYEGGSLVVAGSKAIYKGKGTINGKGTYGFMVSAIDGQVSGGGDIDKFRIKIWDSNGTVYDNQTGIMDDNATPSTAISGGSIVIHAVNGNKTGTKSEDQSEIQTEIVTGEFGVKAYPNPFTDHVYFDLQLKTDSKVRLEIYNSAGAKIATVFDDMVVAFDRYRFEYTPGNLSSSVLIYRIFIDNKMSFTGKLIHK